MSKYNDNSDNPNLWTNRKLLATLLDYVVETDKSRPIIALIQKRFIRSSSRAN